MIRKIKKANLVGWATRAFTPVFDGLWARGTALPSWQSLSCAMPTHSCDGCDLPRVGTTLRLCIWKYMRMFFAPLATLLRCRKVTAPSQGHRPIVWYWLFGRMSIADAIRLV